MIRNCSIADIRLVCPDACFPMIPDTWHRATVENRLCHFEYPYTSALEQYFHASQFFVEGLSGSDTGRTRLGTPRGRVTA